MIHESFGKGTIRSVDGRKLFGLRSGDLYMYSKGNYVVHSNNGICRVEDIVVMDMGEGDKEYYLLIPIKEQASKIYFPTNNTGQRIRMAMDKEKASQLIDNIERVEEICIQNEKECEKIYRENMTSNDPCKLIALIKTITHRKSVREKTGKKCTAVDKKYLKLAVSQLYGELSHALQMENEQLEQLILHKFYYKNEITGES